MPKNLRVRFKDLCSIHGFARLQHLADEVGINANVLTHMDQGWPGSRVLRAKISKALGCTLKELDDATGVSRYEYLKVLSQD